LNIINIKTENNETIGFISDIHIDSVSPPSRIDDMCQTCINKLEDALEKFKSYNVKYVFLEGDITNRISIPYFPLNYLINTFIRYKEAGIKLFSICGNHDIMRNSMDYLDRSPIQVLFNSGLVTHINLENRVVINDDILITPVDYPEYPIPEADGKYKTNILLCHAFINANEFMSDERHNIKTEDIQRLKYGIIIAGHDHEEYENIKIGNTLVIRHGSLLRGTSHDYNFNRHPNVLIFEDIHNINNETIKKVEVAHKPYKDVVSNYVLNKKNKNSASGMKDILSNLADKLSSNNVTDEDRILGIIKTDPDLPNSARLKLLNYITEISN